MRKLAALIAVGALLAILGGAGARAVVARIQAGPVIQYGIAMLVGKYIYHAPSEEGVCRKAADMLRFGQAFIADFEGRKITAQFMYCLVITDGIITDYVRGKADRLDEPHDDRIADSLHQL